MDLQGVVSQLLPLIPVALAVALAVIGVTYGAYALYRKRGGRRTITVLQFAAAFLLLAWFAVVLALTTFSRGAHFEGWFNFRLFSGYASAWHQWSLSEWQLIVFNMLMFAPLGFLLPLLARGMRRLLPVLVVSLVVTTGIELFQMFTRRGIFELDDLLHNTLGSIAGYLLMSAILDIAERRRLAFKPIAKAAAIPLACALLFAGALIVYHAKELGNLSIRPAIAQNMDRVEVVLNAELPTDAGTVSLYYSDRIHNREYGEAMAALMARSFDLRLQGGMRIDGFNRIWMLLDGEGREYTFNYNLPAGWWWLSTEDDANGAMTPEQLAERGEHYASWLLESGLLPPNAIFGTQNEDTVRWDLHPAAEGVTSGNADYAEGFIMIEPSETAEQAPHHLFYEMKVNRYVRDVDIVSPSEAYKAIRKGRFAIFNDLQPGDRLQVDAYELDYLYDSKGYYQPVYRFQGSVNDSHWEAYVPAVSE